MVTTVEYGTEQERWRRKCADCGHPRGFHGRRDGYLDKCIGVYRQPPCPCRSFVEPAEADGEQQGQPGRASEAAAGRTMMPRLVPQTKLVSRCLHCGREVARTRWFADSCLPWVLVLLGRQPCLCGGPREVLSETRTARLDVPFALERPRRGRPPKAWLALQARKAAA